MDLIHSRLFDEGLSVTCKWLSRQQGIATQSAAERLLQFMSTTDKPLNVLYYVTGKSRDCEDQIRCIVVPSYQLQNCKESLVDASHYIYSIVPSPMDMTNNLNACLDCVCQVNLDVMMNEDYSRINKYRVIKCDPAIIQSVLPSTTRLVKEKSVVSQSVSSRTTVDVSKKSVDDNNKKKKKAEPFFQTKASSKKKSASIPAQSEAKKDVVMEEAVESECSPVQKRADKPTKTDSKQSTPKKKNPSTAVNAKEQLDKLSRLFEDDSEDETPAANDVVEKQQVTEEHPEKKTKKRVVKLRDDEEEEDATEKPRQSTISVKSAPMVEQRRVRKRRKIHKTETYMDGKYMKTKDISDWESYSEDEMVIVSSKPEQVPQVVQKPKQQSSDDKGGNIDDDEDALQKQNKDSKASKKKNVPGQKSLLSFFGKKSN